MTPFSNASPSDCGTTGATWRNKRPDTDVTGEGRKNGHPVASTSEWFKRLSDRMRTIGDGRSSLGGRETTRTERPAANMRERLVEGVYQTETDGRGWTTEDGPLEVEDGPLEMGGHGTNSRDR